MTDKKRIQICIETTEELRNKLKMVALKRNITMNKWIMRQIEQGLLKERENDN